MVRCIGLLHRCACWLLLAGIAACGQNPAVVKEPTSIQDNSFLLEEAYNQENGVVQHVSMFTRMWNSRDWNFSFTQEWPGAHNWRHQLSYTVLGVHSGVVGGRGAGLGDVIFNYRYQVYGSADSKVAFSPRLSLLLPSGNPSLGRGAGGSGVQLNLPVSLVLHRRLVSHWNAGATLIPRAQDPDGNRAQSVGYNFGQSFVYLAHSRFNLMLETTASRFQSVTGPGTTEWNSLVLVSPGVRWAHNFSSGLQIVPGVAVPFGIARSTGEKGLVLYLSFEHLFKHPAS